MPKKEKLKEKPKKKKGLLNSNFLVTLFFLITVAVVATNRYDRRHRSKIHVEVDKNLVQETTQEEEIQNKISIFVYDPATKTVNEREIAVPRQMNLIEGDFINGIIRNSNYVNTTVVKLNAAFANLKKDTELFNGFSQAVTNTILKNFPNIQSVIIQIDGETSTR